VILQNRQCIAHGESPESEGISVAVWLHTMPCAVATADSQWLRHNECAPYRSNGLTSQNKTGGPRSMQGLVDLRFEVRWRISSPGIAAGPAQGGTRQQLTLFLHLDIDESIVGRQYEI